MNTSIGIEPGLVPPSDGVASTVGMIGEKRLINEVLDRYAATAGSGRTEDCIVIDPDSLATAGGMPLIVYSVDHCSLIDRPLSEGSGWRYHGRWLAACTCNDVLAMGGQPRGFAVDLAIAPDTPVSAVQDLYVGIADVLDVYGARLEGGNTDINTRTETVAMCWGTVPRSGLIRRRGARPGDYIVVTTELGLGWASFVLRKLGSFGDLSADNATLLERYNLMPLAPHQAIVSVAAGLPGAITSGMDLSDGLCEFLYLITQTGLGALLDEQLLPCSPLLAECAALLEVPRAALAIEYGFDMPRAHGYTVAPDRWDAVKSTFDSFGWPIYRIGEVVTQPEVCWRTASGKPRTIPRFWDDKCERLDVISRWFDMVSTHWPRGTRDE